ncbi:MAG: DNA modification methylase [Planctomycetes bacterium]|nr:DNA modification methylase [Planctomycetota bacterium]
MKVELRSIDAVHPYDRHARRIAAAVDAVAESIRRFGFRQPIVVDAAGVILCGHVRYEAARRLGLRRVPVHIAGELTAAEARAYRLADNKLAELATWDEDLLAAELAELQAMAVNLDGLGFSERELAELLAGAVEDDLDAPPPAPREAASRPGAMYRLGDHRLLVGDATRGEDLVRLMGEERADLLLTDPPYNVAYEGKTTEALRIENDAMDDAAFLAFLIDAFRAADAVMGPGAVFYIWHADSEGFNFRSACRAVGWQIRQCLVWVKNAMVLGRQDYQWRHEPCLYGWKDGAGHTWLGGRKQTTIARADPPWQAARVPDGWCVVIDGQACVIRGRGVTVQPVESTALVFDRPARNADHPTMKPVDLFEHQIRNSARRGALVLDPFGGSGTTVIAAEQTGRRARTLEFDARYADVIRRRWAELVHGEGCDWQALTPPAD